jgi:hypothetical protein
VRGHLRLRRRLDRHLHLFFDVLADTLERPVKKPPTLSRGLMSCSSSDTGIGSSVLIDGSTGASAGPSSFTATGTVFLDVTPCQLACELRLDRARAPSPSFASARLAGMA